MNGMIQWLTQDSLDSLLNESVFLNEWFNDSLKIHLIHYWMNQCFWMNLLNEWFNDSLKIHLFHYWMNQCFWMNLLNEWFNDSLKIHFFHYWMNQWFWMNDSMTHSRFICFITGWISGFEWMIQWLTQNLLDSLLNESVFLNQSLEWMIQRQFLIWPILSIWFWNWNWFSIPNPIPDLKLWFTVSYRLVFISWVESVLLSVTDPVLYLWMCKGKVLVAQALLEGCFFRSTSVVC